MSYKGLFEMPQIMKNRLWPNLSPINHELKSEVTDKYNCVAWANGRNDQPIDLSLDENQEPLEYPDLTCLTYIEYFETQGFVLCDKSDWEEGYEKIALYEREEKTFEHVARLINENVWTSKLGEWEDIEHTLEALTSNSYYGIPTWFMKRKL